MSEFAFEPVHGLPENLPPGEALRWQGAPHWRVLARRAFHARTVAFYFGLLILIQFAYLLLGGGAGLKEAVLAAFWLFLLGGLAVGILVLLAWLYSRSTVYSITDRRLVIRFGVALPMAVNIPFKIVESAGLRTYPDGSGDIPLVLGSGQKVSYLIMWPNVRPWRFSNAQPMLRAIPDAKNVAEILAEALHSATADTDTEADEAAVPRSSGSTDTGKLETAAAKAGGR
ncbi:photosynthetic complex putative assembly protein PuhB [Halochromatium glycolicum]|uniref:Phosphopantetheine adenylyltransferase n=1 Tax=Halochromatium glycolicum TaxID=85075 RepID=A0AAJ0X9Q7_9GAMM|nr:phosphopantetheine adenylyltransferase [Halochromatium glycolicum]